MQVRYQGQVAAVSVSAPYGPSVEFEFAPQIFIDELAAAEWKRLGVKPAPLADDATYLRRVFLDLIGTLPTVDETRKFLTDVSPQKRTRVVDELLGRPEYVDYWSLRWGDLLRAHRRYLGDKGLASFSGWIRQSVRENKPLDMLTRELLTAQGNLFANGAVAYFFIDEKVEELAETTSQVVPGSCDCSAHAATIIRTRSGASPTTMAWRRSFRGFKQRTAARSGPGLGDRRACAPQPQKTPTVSRSSPCVRHAFFGEADAPADATADPAAATGRLDHATRQSLLRPEFREPLLGGSLSDAVSWNRWTTCGPRTRRRCRFCSTRLARDFAEHLLTIRNTSCV